MAKDDFESSVERRAALFEQAIDRLGESVLLVDRDGKQFFANKELKRFQGEIKPAEDADTWRHPERMTILDTDGRELAYNEWPIARALRGEHTDNWEITVRGMAHRPGDTILVVTTRALRSDDGEIEGAMVVSRDVTDTRKTEAALRQSQKLETIGQLTGGVAHDFNNLLAAILSAAEVLKIGVSAEPRLAHATSTIEKGALRGAELTKHLLSFARRQALQPSSIDVTAMINETLMLLRPALGAGIDVKVEAPAHHFVHADPTLLTSALLNLCINARDAMHGGGELRIKVDEVDGAAPLAPGRYVRLAVSDTGSGMSPETIRRAVEPFFTTKGVGKGSGLGLSMVYGFVHQSGGDLKITSALGKGTTISLLLPRTDAPVAQASEQHATPEQAKAVRVLVVDDDDLVRDAVCMQLSAEGFDAASAPDGIAALEMIEGGHAFDVLITDMVMPRGMNGIALAEEVRKRRPDVRAIISTGYAELDFVAPEGSRLNILRKPYTSAQLFAALKAAMNGGGAAAKTRRPG